MSAAADTQHKKPPALPDQGGKEKSAGFLLGAKEPSSLDLLSKFRRAVKIVSGTSSVRRFLDHSPAINRPLMAPVPKVLVLPQSMPLFDAWQLLLSAHVSSAPVVHPETKAVVGMVDLVDIMTALTDCFTGVVESSVKDIDMDAFVRWVSHEHNMTEISMRVVANASRMDALVKMPPTTVMSEIVDLLIRRPDVKRVVIVDAKGRAMTVITAGDTLRCVRMFLLSDPRIGFRIENMTLAKIGPERSKWKVHSVFPDASVLSAFRLMKEQGVEAIAVTDRATGALVANISATDVKLMGLEEDGPNFYRWKSSLNTFCMSVSDFIKGGHQRKARERRRTAFDEARPPPTTWKEKLEHWEERVKDIKSRPLVYAQLGSTVGDALDAIFVAGLHRIFVVHGVTREPLFCVSIRDFLRIFSTLVAESEAGSEGDQADGEKEVGK